MKNLIVALSLLLCAPAIAATSSINVTEGSGKEIATYSISEDATTKQVQRISVNDSSGNEVGTAGAPLRVDPTGTTPQPVTGTFWQATQPVSGTFWQATQPVSGTVTVTDGAGALNTIVDSGTVAISQTTTDNDVDANITNGSLAVTGTFWQATQPVSGSVTADTELPTAAAISAENTAAPTAPSVYAFPVVFDGTNWDRLKGDSTDGMLVNLGANNDVSVTSMPTTTVTATNLDVQIGGSDTLTVQATNLDVRDIDYASDDIGIRGILTPLGDSMIDDTNDALKVNLVAGGAGDGAIQDGVTSSIEATVLDYTNSNPLAVRLTDTNGDYIAAGAGTQYTEGDTDATITGTAMMMEGAGNALVAAPGTAADGLLVNLGTNNDVTVTGTVTANAGSGTFVVGDGAGALNVIVDSGSITASDPTFTDATGTTVPANAAFIGGTDGTNTRALKTDASGELQVDVLTMPTTTVTATNLDVQIGGSDTVTVQATNLDVQIGGSDSLTIGTFPDNEPINVAQKGGATVIAGPCEREVPLYAQINQATDAQIITGTASERIYICSAMLVSATAQNVAVIDGTGSVCATSPTGLLGGSTAATGQNLAANGGFVLPFNPGGWAKTSTDADNVCIDQSSTGQVSGVITYVSVANI